MKSLIATFAAATLLAACSSPADSPVASLVAKRDSIKNLRTSLAAELLELEAQIAAADTAAANSATVVTAMPVAKSRFEHFFTVQGAVETDQNAQIFPEAAGRIMTISVNEGERVSKGQLLMSIDSKIVSNQIDEVKSRLGLAETVYKKQEKLWEQKIGSEIQYLEAKNNYESLKQNLETLQAQLAMYAVKAPFDGVVDEVLPKEGEMASPAMPAFRLINTNNVYIKADVTERYLGKIKAGDSVAVTFPSIGQTLHTSIERIGNFINPNNRTFKVRLSMKNSGDALKPNLLGELKIRDYVNPSAVVIPTSLLQQSPSGEEFVYVANGTTAVRTVVKSGLSYGDQSEIVSGLDGTEMLVVKGARAIKDGETIVIENQ